MVPLMFLSGHLGDLGVLGFWDLRLNPFWDFLSLTARLPPPIAC